MPTIKIKCQRCGHSHNLQVFLSSEKTKNTFQSVAPTTRLKGFAALPGFLLGRYNKAHSSKPDFTIFESFIPKSAGELIREKFKINSSPSEALIIMQKLAGAYALPYQKINGVARYKKWTRENSEKAGIGQTIHNQLTARFLKGGLLEKDNPNAIRPNYHLTIYGRRTLRGFLYGRYQLKTNNSSKQK